VGHRKAAAGVSELGSGGAGRQEKPLASHGRKRRAAAVHCEGYLEQGQRREGEQQGYPFCRFRKKERKKERKREKEREREREIE
jgi:hypothetical protein